MKVMKLLYSTDRVMSRFKQNFPNEDVVSIEPSKIIMSKKKISGVDILNLNWLLSKRTNIILTENFIAFGNTIIEREYISEQEITKFKTFFGLIKYQTIRFNFQDSYYYAGMNWTPKWQQALSANSDIKEVKKSQIWTIVLIISLLLLMFYKHIF